MGASAGEHEPWAIRLPGDEATRKAGENLREWAGDERGRVRRLFDRVTVRELNDPKLADAWGEEVVAKELAKLETGWAVLHGVRIGPKGDVDHLVIGPAGVFTMNTKRIAFESKVVVSARQFRVDGYSRDYYPKAVREAERVADRLSAAVGATVAVRPVLVVTGVDRKNIRVKAEPADVAVVTRRQLLAWLQHQPQILPPRLCSSWRTRLDIRLRGIRPRWPRSSTSPRHLAPQISPPRRSRCRQCLSPQECRWQLLRRRSLRPASRSCGGGATATTGST